MFLDFTFPPRQVAAAGSVFVFTQLLSALPSAGASPCAGDSRLLRPRRADPSCLRSALLLLPPASRYSAAPLCRPSTYSAPSCSCRYTVCYYTFAGLLLPTHFLAHAATLCCPTLFCPAKNHMLCSVQVVNLSWMTVV